MSRAGRQSSDVTPECSRRAGVDQRAELTALSLLPVSISAVVRNPTAVVGTAVSISAVIAAAVLVLGTVAVTVSTRFHNRHPSHRLLQGLRSSRHGCDSERRACRR